MKANRVEKQMWKQMWPRGPVVKFCGLTRREDLLVACELGAWAVGFVFAPSLRRVTPANVSAMLAQLAQRQGDQEQATPLAVGVFTDEPAPEIARVVREAHLTAVQLHSPAAPAGAVRRLLGPEVLLIQALPVDPAQSEPSALAERVEQVAEEVDVLLFDTQMAGRFGGTGTSFSWQVLRELAPKVPYLVAGGITPANVQRALDESGAWGVDVSSGVEKAPGIKDAQLMRQLVANLRAGEASGRVYIWETSQ